MRRDERDETKQNIEEDRRLEVEEGNLNYSASDQPISIILTSILTYWDEYFENDNDTVDLIERIAAA